MTNQLTALLTSTNNGASKQWLYSKAEKAIFAVVDARGSCSLRVFSLDGTFVGIARGKKVHSAKHFGAVLSGCSKLTIKDQPNLEEVAVSGLPGNVVKELAAQIK
jgi:hypothetical protein